MELWLGFHIGFVGKLNAKKKLIMDGKAVAWYYVQRGQFYVDALTAVAWIAQVLAPSLSCAALPPTTGSKNQCQG